MANRNTKTEKWRDAWFSSLPKLSRYLFLYLCDNCDIAGFIEFVPKVWVFETDLSNKEIEKCIKDLNKALLFSTDNQLILIKNFIKHQNNLPINPENNAHKAILKRFEIYLSRFNDIELINKILGGSEGVTTPPVMYCNVMSCNSNVKEKKIQKPKDVILGYDETWNSETGKRMLFDQVIPNDAPPRPSKQYAWGGKQWLVL